jgi:hypothetical protein
LRNDIHTFLSHMLCVDIPSEASYDVILRSIQAGMDTTDRPIPIVLVTNPISGLSRCAPFDIIIILCITLCVL